MPGRYIIGVDGGSQSSKVAVYDLEGNVVCEGRQALRPVSRPRNGIVEHPDDDLWDSIAAASRQAMAKFPGDPRDIIGVGLCTIRCERAFLREDGSLASPVMSWMDTRAYQPYVHEDPAVAYVTTSSGYLTHRFTGRFVDTSANSIEGQWPVDADTWQWSEDPAVLALWNIPREMLFDLQMPGTILGYVTREAGEASGIPEGIPVVATANDKAVEALAAGSLAENTALVSLGTYIAAMVLGRENVHAPSHFWTNFACVPGVYLYESYGIRRGMWTVSWFKDLLGEGVTRPAESLGLTAEQYLDREAEKVPAGSDGLMTIPDWLAPSSEPFRKGVMIGFDARHTRAHVYRSILEAIALTMKNRVDAMCEELGIALDSIVLSGGGSESPLFMRIFADVFGIPSSRSVGGGGAGLGSAICVAVATGAYPNFETAVARMTKSRESFAPDPANVDVYERMNEAVYKIIPGVTDEILKRSYPIFQ
ncbi:MAG: sugar kinase [Actinobacteria bacterium]|nr:sugar kinase [Actinomycetota bacterium]